MVLQVNKLLQEHLAMNGILILLKHEIRLEIVLLIKFNKYSQMYNMFTRFLLLRNSVETLSRDWN